MLLIGVLGNQVLRTHWLETGFLALLPASEQQPDIAKAIQQHNELMASKVVWLTGAASSQAAIAQAQQLKTRLQQSGLFNRVVLEQSSQTYSDNYQRLFPFRYQLLDSQTQRVLHENSKALISENLAMLYSPIGQLQAASLERDPLLLFNRYFNAQQPIKFNLEQGVVVLHEQATVWALLVSDLKDNNLPLDQLETLLALVNQAQAADGELMVSGMPLFTASGAQSAQQEMSTVGVGSSVAIVLLMLMTFRSLRPLTLSFLAITSGMFAALVLSVWFFGKLHIITLVFGASLIGVADDYALHFFVIVLNLKTGIRAVVWRLFCPAYLLGY
jgi:predicted exporter